MITAPGYWRDLAQYALPLFFLIVTILSPSYSPQKSFLIFFCRGLETGNKFGVALLND